MKRKLETFFAKSETTIKTTNFKNYRMHEVVTNFLISVFRIQFSAFYRSVAAGGGRVEYKDKSIFDVSERTPPQKTKRAGENTLQKMINSY
jgi:predicted transposase YdaD